MMKFGSIALTLILAASLMTACRAPVTDETTAPSTAATTPSTSVTTPATSATTPSATPPVTLPEPSGTEDATEGSGGINSMDPSGSSNSKRRMMPGR